MIETQNYLLTLSLILWGILIILGLFKRKKAYLPWFLIQTVLIGVIVYGFHYYLGYWDSLEHKFTLDYSEVLVLIGLYLATTALAMQLGLAFQNGFFWKTILDQVGSTYAKNTS